MKKKATKPSFMKLKDVVKLARQQGIKVRYKNRKDGGIIIKSIAGKKFKGVKGNKELRHIVNQPLSFRRLTANRDIAKTRYMTLDAQIQHQLKQTNVALKKSKIGGKITKTQLRKMIQEKGFASAYESLEKAERHASGYTYDANITAFLEKYKRSITLLMEDFDKDTIKRMNRIYNKIDNMIGRGMILKEEDFMKFQQMLYKLNQGIDSNLIFEDDAMIDEILDEFEEIVDASIH